jgi:hypothetical protein
MVTMLERYEPFEPLGWRIVGRSFGAGIKRVC